MTNFIDDNGVTDFIDDNGVTLFVDTNGVFLGVGGTEFVLSDRAIDFGLQVLADEADKIYLCSAEPTTYTEAVTALASPAVGFALGVKDFGSPGGAFSAISSSASPDIPGRSVASTAITNGSITVSGTVTFWAAVDSANSRLLARGTVSTSKAVVSGSSFSLPSFNLRMPGQ